MEFQWPTFFLVGSSFRALVPISPSGRFAFSFLLSTVSTLNVSTLCFFLLWSAYSNRLNPVLKVSPRTSVVSAPHSEFRDGRVSAGGSARVFYFLFFFNIFLEVCASRRLNRGFGERGRQVAQSQLKLTLPIKLVCAFVAGHLAVV